MIKGESLDGLINTRVEKTSLARNIRLRVKGEKLTPIQRKLIPEQLQEVHELIDVGVPVRQVAKQAGISRGALVGLLKGKN